MRGRGGRSWTLGVLLLIAGLVIGTQVGWEWSRALGPLGHTVRLGPAKLSLDVLGVSMWVRTNVLGLVVGAVGLVLGVSRG